MSIDALFAIHYDIPPDAKPTASTHGSELIEALDGTKPFEFPVLQGDCRWFDGKYFFDSSSILVDAKRVDDGTEISACSLQFIYDTQSATGDLYLTIPGQQQQHLTSRNEYAFRRTNYD